MNDTNASTSCADQVLVEDWVEEDENDSSSVENSSNSNILSPVVSKNCVTQDANSEKQTVEKYKPKKFVKRTKCTCSCDCGNPSKQNSFGPRPSPDHIVLKRQTCFNCGTPGHIARNCPHRPYVPYYAQNWQNVPRRKSSKRRNSYMSRSSDGD